ncbi:Hypothetical predicted protein [Marmota monax]|uniref:Uncharacterized protein n=1 Tax=Marmota monax TaxID=9995 RepID=A0A5E4BAM0_MARMO|nr:hypothetical protein GHT09_012240 [Marmota monax]VTJ65702.1 Hypothetical predicted protein [Marmota monax]
MAAAALESGARLRRVLELLPGRARPARSCRAPGADRRRGGGGRRPGNEV